MWATRPDGTKWKRTGKPGTAVLCPYGGNATLLWGGLFGEGFDAGRGELEADLPFAGNAAAGHFGRSEFPAAHGLQSEVREIFAGAGIIEFG